MRQKLAYGKLGYRTDKWFLKWLGRYNELKKNILFEENSKKTLEYVRDKIISDKVVKLGDSLYSYSTIGYISFDDLNLDLSNILSSAQNGKRYLLHRDYKAINENVSNYTLYDEYDEENNYLVLYQDKDKLIENIDKQLNELNSRLDNKYSKIREIGKDIMFELGVKREKLGV